MVRVYCLLIFAAANIFCANIAVAREGFSNAATPIPSVIQNAWNATVKINKNIQTDSAKTAQTLGAGVVIGYDATRRASIIATNGHVGACPGLKQCSYSITFYSETKNQKIFNTVSIIKEFSNNDLVFLSVATENFAPAVAQFWPYAPTLSENQNVVAVGYPRLSLRKNEDWQTAPPDDSTRIIKRFSIGQLVGKLSIKNPNYPYALSTKTFFSANDLLTHNADILDGSSGGPLIDTQSGYVVGINTGMIKAPANLQHCESATSTQTPNCTYFSIPSNLILKNFYELN